MPPLSLVWVERPRTTFLEGPDQRRYPKTPFRSVLHLSLAPSRAPGSHLPVARLPPGGSARIGRPGALIVGERPPGPGLYPPAPGPNNTRATSSQSGGSCP